MNRLASCLMTTMLVVTPFAANANKALAEKNGCLGCHATAIKLVGPAYKDVAATYSGQRGATDMLARSIRAGGAGKWGEMAMPPQPQVSESDARKLAAWILRGAK